MKGKVVIFAKDSEKAINTAAGIKEFLLSEGYRVITLINKAGRTPSRVNLKDCLLIVVVGGDGTFLAGARLGAKFSVPLVGVNEGKFGFLTEVDSADARTVIKDALKGRLRKHRRMMLSTFLKRKGKIKFLGDYLNDVVVAKSALARMVKLDVHAGREFMVRVYGDGVIVSTPTGSTAYALSAGGPIIYPDSENFLVVPICPHTLSNRPMVLPSSFSIEIVVGSQDRASFLTMDGQKGMYMLHNDKIEIRKSRRFCEIYVHPERGFFEILRTKLKWG